MSVTISPILMMLLSFTCGYGVRELISQRRRAVARKNYYEGIRERSERVFAELKYQSRKPT
jgi:hypothetical protein